jgi:carnitine-CoA ligase
MNDWMRSDRATLGGYLVRNAEAHPDRVVHVSDGTALTDGELLSASYAFANAYHDLGARPGDVIATLMPNSVEHAYSWGACSFLGTGHLPCNTHLRGDFLRHQLGTAEAKIAVVDQSLAERVVEIRRELPHLQHLILRGMAAEAKGFAGGDLNVLSTEEVLAGESAMLKVTRSARHDDLNAIIFTGGTTGPSKGVAMSQGYVHYLLGTSRRCWGWTPESVSYQPLPLFHINALAMTILQPVVGGGRGVTASRLTISGFWDEVRKYGATHLSLFGSLYLMLYRRPETERDADNPAQVSIGYCPAEIHEDFQRRFGIKIYGAYALSEAHMIAHTTPDDVPPHPWSGRPNPDFEIRLLDEDGDEVPSGEVGEICVRPKKPNIMFDGYFNAPAGTLATFKHLWFHTNDLGRFSPDGYLAFVDRKVDYLRRRGENISTYEIEQVILHHPAISEVAVHGVPSDIGEEEVKACLILAPGAEIDYIEFLNFCADRMPYYAVPRFIEIFDDLPRSPVGRVQKFRLKEIGLNENTYDAGVWLAGRPHR